jgi:hypothetical protein
MKIVFNPINLSSNISIQLILVLKANPSFKEGFKMFRRQKRLIDFSKGRTPGWTFNGFGLLVSGIWIGFGFL